MVFRFMESFTMMSPSSPLIEHEMPWVMTIPTSIPWSLPFYTDAQMTFTAKSVESNSPTMIVTSQMKRKGSHLDAPLPSKIYISEEKMIARMKELDINAMCAPPPSQETAQTSVLSDLAHARCLESRVFLDDVDSGFIDMDDFAPPSETKDPILILSEEVRKSIANPDPILPTTLLEKIQKPSMELVLWTPPGGIVSSLIKAKTAALNNNKPSQQYRNNNNDLNKEQPVLKARKTLSSRDDTNTDNFSKMSPQSSFSHLFLDDPSTSQKGMETMDL